MALHADAGHMAAALALARRGLGNVAPNPAVGCILVQGGRIVGRGWTQPGGRPHAETEALARAGDRAQGATAYVTLEPCSHTGQTGPCADALIAAGVSRVVTAMEDPDTRVSGRGLQRLRDAGISVDCGLMEAEARLLNRGFILHRTVGRPLVTLKLATSLDGRIATAGGESQWITGPEARADAHLLRLTHDAVLVGIGTALADNPSLTCRLPGVTGQGLRVVLDSQGRLPETAALCDAAAPTLQLTAIGCTSPVPASIRRLEVPLGDQGGLSIPAVLEALAKEGVTRLMVEGGGQVAAAFLDADCVDDLVCYQAPLVLGAEGIPAIGPLNVQSLAISPRFQKISVKELGADQGLTFRRP